MQNRATSERNLAAADAYLKEIEKLLTPGAVADPAQRAKLLDAKAQLIAAETKYQAELDEDKADLARADSDLARIEADMKFFACL